MSRRGLVATSGKVSFCLQDVRRGEGDSGAPAPWPVYYGCFGGMGMMGISPGWMDVYGPSLSGQYIPLTQVPDGVYALVIHTDPGARVHESDDNDNMSVTGVEVYNQRQSVRIRCTGTPGTIVCDRPVNP